MVHPSPSMQTHWKMMDHWIWQLGLKTFENQIKPNRAAKQSEFCMFCFVLTGVGWIMLDHSFQVTARCLRAFVAPHMVQ
jgi:hypothetical protein